MKKIFFISLIVVIATVAAYLIFFREPTFTARNGYLNNINDKGVIIEGYDPIAYFTDNKPIKGDSKFKAEYNGATYWFASAEHAELFKKQPLKYAPQYGA